MSAEQKTAEVVKSQDILAPERELVTPDGYRWFVYNYPESGIRLVCIEDIETGIVFTTPVVSDKTRVASHKAWAGARQSRSPGTPWEILQEMGLRGVDPDQKLDETFSKYGHASVGDMARIVVDGAYCPMHLCFVLFGESPINSGQEKSTRYQKKFGTSALHDIAHYLPKDLDPVLTKSMRGIYEELGVFSIRHFEQYRELLTQAFREYYRPDPGDASHKSALDSRVLDCARYFLLFGQSSGLSFETSSRDWSRIIGELKVSPVRLYQRVALQIERLLTPSLEEEQFLGYKAEAPSLVRHTKPAETTNNNLLSLRKFVKSDSTLLQDVETRFQFRGRVEQDVFYIPEKYSEAERMVLQYLLTLWPGLDKHGLLEWVHSQPEEMKRKISSIIFNGHDNYHELPYLARTTGMSFVLESFLGEDRDFNRHRAYGRFSPLPLTFGLPVDYRTARQILAKGFGLPLYLTEVPEFYQQRTQFERDLNAYYDCLSRFVDYVHKNAGSSIDYAFTVNLLPLAHQLDFWMHGDPKQALYMPAQRTRPGGHINYRTLAFQVNREIANSDAYLSALKMDSRPDPGSREEFFNRS